MKTMKKLVFFLGGADAEMVEISKVLAQVGAEIHNAGLGWGAAASVYAAEISAVAAAGGVPVLVELNTDIDLPEGVILVDHHGDRSSEPASILQVLSLLGLEPNRWQQLIAANDSGYIPAMVEMGATSEEVAAVRLADRSAQGITPEQEEAAEAAIAGREVAGRLTVVHLPHSKCATVTDRLFGQYDQLLVLSGDGEVNFYGDGQLCSVLKESFDGWNGGSGLAQKGGSAFWGGYPNHAEIEAFIKYAFGEKFVNLTPHMLRLNDGRVLIPAAPAPRVAASFSEFDAADGITEQKFGEITGLPEPQAGKFLVVSGMLLTALAGSRRDVVAPATGHPDVVRENGQIVSVPGFTR